MQDMTVEDKAGFRVMTNCLQNGMPLYTTSQTRASRDFDSRVITAAASQGLAAGSFLANRSSQFSTHVYCGQTVADLSYY